MLTGGLGALSHPPTRVPRPKADGTATLQPSRRRGRREGERESATGMSEAQSQSAPWEENAHAHDGGRKVLGMRYAPPAIRRSGLGRRETSSPPVLPYGAQDSVGRPRRESGESEPGTHEARVHVVRLGGRNRSDASRVFCTERSQGLLVKEGASQEEVRSRD